MAAHLHSLSIGGVKAKEGACDGDVIDGSMNVRKSVGTTRNREISHRH
jgi:hypothetical protein